MAFWKGEMEYNNIDQRDCTVINSSKVTGSPIFTYMSIVAFKNVGVQITYICMQNWDVQKVKLSIPQWQMCRMEDW
jgi:5,10-methylene-tetrahydrofolate dehydrogenase/methenyl tetrahydrofolate cyclohydrolase